MRSRSSPDGRVEGDPARTLLNDTLALTLEVCWQPALIPPYTAQSNSKPAARPETIDTAETINPVFSFDPSIRREEVPWVF